MFARTYILCTGTMINQYWLTKFDILSKTLLLSKNSGLFIKTDEVTTKDKNKDVFAAFVRLGNFWKN